MAMVLALRAAVHAFLFWATADTRITEVRLRPLHHHPSSFFGIDITNAPTNHGIPPQGVTPS
eukprot:3008853-Rhodomonas_salina.6